MKSRLEIGGRHPRPFALGLSIALFGVFWQYVVVRGPLFGDEAFAPGVSITGHAALISSGLLWAGYWFRSRMLMEWGMLLGSGVWMAVMIAAVYLTHSPVWLLMTASWLVGSAGAFFLEAADRRAHAKTGTMSSHD